jgi:DNA-binding LytR/AlgR family response regulator
MVKHPESMEVEKVVPYIFVKEDRKMHRIDLHDINYIEAVGDYVKISTYQKNRITYMSMKKMETLLPEGEFCRVHKSYIVNLAKISSVEGNRVVLKDIELPIGQNYRARFIEWVKQSNRI